MSKPIFWEKVRKNNNLSAEFSQNVIKIRTITMQSSR